MRFPPAAALTFVVLLPMSSHGSASLDEPTLVTDSPFLPPGFEPPGRPGEAPGRPPAPGEYEFRGVYQFDNKYYFNLYNVRDQRGRWITEGRQAEDQPEVVDFNPETNRISVRVEGRLLDLALASTSDKPMPVRTASANSVAPATETKPDPPARRNLRRPARRRVIRPSARTPASPKSTTRRRVIRANP